MKNYLGDLYSAGCYSSINVPTRIYPTCTSTLDHIYTNSINKTRLSGVLIFDLSDHLPTFCILQTAGKPNKKETSNRLIHDMKNFNIETYAEDAYNRLQCLSLLSDPDTDLNNLMKIIQEVTSIHAPLRRPSRKEMKAKSKPWLTKGLLKSVKTKNKMFQLCYKQHDVDLIMKYKKYRNKLTKLTQIAKRMYYQNQLTSHKNDLSQRWKIISEIICNRKRYQEMITSIIDSDGKEVSDQSIISKTLNEFFVNIGPNMDAKIPPSRNIFNIPSVVNSFAYEPISNDEVYLQLSQLNPRKANGPENLPNKFWNLLAPIISPFLANIFNECFEVGKFPATLKQAKVIPIHKGGPKNVATNYRPISLLSPISKVFEKLIYCRLENFLTKHNIISTQQYGFREGHSTEMVIVDLTNKLKLHIDEGYLTCCIFLDLSKAFDTVNHKILLKKLEAYGIRGNMQDLLSSYPSNRQQYTECNGAQSENNVIKCGVPQGSTLGPFLFLLYVNDLPLHTKFYVNLFADDTVLMLKNRNIDHLQQQVTEQLNGINDWMIYNRLSINYSKTTYFITQPRNKRKLLNEINIKMGELTIQEQNNAKYLGIHIDRALKWNLQIENVINKLASAARILCKIRHYVDRQTLINLCYTFAYPHLKYGVLAWGNADKTLMQKITVMQNRIIRIINFKLLKDHVKMSVLYKAMNILQAPDIFKLEVGKFMHSFHHHTLPESCQSYFTPTKLLTNMLQDL